MTTKTLSDHCREYYAEKGIKYPTVDTELNKLLYSEYVEHEKSEDAYDTLLTNGMLDRYELHIVAIEHDPTMREERLKALQKKNPNQEYKVQGDIINSVHYLIAHGSNADTTRYDIEEINEIAEQTGLIPVVISHV